MNDMTINNPFDSSNSNCDPNPGFLNTETQDSLTRYLQSMHPELVSQLSQPQSPEVVQVMEQNVAVLLGNLPHGQFNIAITTSKENLGRLLASAMVNGYFLRNAEMRHSIERSLQTATVDSAHE